MSEQAKYLSSCVLCGDDVSAGSDFCVGCIDQAHLNFGRCYVCKDADHKHCIGPPCQCQCPHTEEAPMSEQPTVTITQAEYGKLLKAQRRMYVLEKFGVDNWEGYGLCQDDPNWNDDDEDGGPDA